MQTALDPPARRTGTARPAGRAAPALNERGALTLQAMQLLGRWQRVCNGHLSFTLGCGACGFGASVDLRDFDDMLLDYLLTRFAGAARLLAFITAQAEITRPGSGSLKALLRGVATARTTPPLVQLGELLRAIEASIASIEEQHAA